ncbi:MAG: GNAT superfamily N-acetyltransferase [Flavobacteriaceae bacterium]|jgi:GNAT superfamily N-acetyltransferase|tara:strand:+ start:441 stop:875 length:435 start_codon:yes stop_codon:yes gene_type:complete
MNVQIKKINAEQTYELRQPLDSCHLPLDSDIKSIHLGAYFENQLIGVLSAFRTSCPEYESKKGIQFRAIAVLPSFQRKRIASQLIQKIFSIGKDLSILHNIWLNARITENDLYLKNDFTEMGDVFEIASIGTHQRFIKTIRHES